MDLVAIVDRILDAAGVLEPRIPRTLDASHVATAPSITAADALSAQRARAFDGLRRISA